MMFEKNHRVTLKMASPKIIKFFNSLPTPLWHGATKIPYPPSMTFLSFYSDLGVKEKDNVKIHTGINTCEKSIIKMLCEK